MPRGERFYYRHKAKVIDGTRCNDESLDVCVDGQCEVLIALITLLRKHKLQQKDNIVHLTFLRSLVCRL